MNHLSRTVIRKNPPVVQTDLEYEGTNETWQAQGGGLALRGRCRQHPVLSIPGRTEIISTGSPAVWPRSLPNPAEVLAGQRSVPTVCPAPRLPSARKAEHKRICEAGMRSQGFTRRSINVPLCSLTLFFSELTIEPSLEFVAIDNFRFAIPTTPWVFPVTG